MPSKLVFVTDVLCLLWDTLTGSFKATFNEQPYTGQREYQGVQ
jgi:hypothetical protein